MLFLYSLPSPGQSSKVFAWNFTVFLEIHNMLVFIMINLVIISHSLQNNQNVQRKISENYWLFIGFSLLKLDQNIWIIDEIKNLKLKTFTF